MGNFVGIESDKEINHNAADINFQINYEKKILV